MTKLIHKLAISLAVLSAFAGSASAEVKTHPTAKVSIDIPSNWTSKSDGDVMMVTDPTQDVAFIIVVAELADLNSAVAGLDKKLAGTLTDVKWAGKPQDMALNGMKGIKNQGTGKVNGKPADLGLIVVKTPAKKAFLVVAAVDSAKKAAHKDEIKAVLNSIKPAP
jgi:hypothetical protein